jgi:hypothetical protein
MNVFDFVEKMDRKYGKDWEIWQISQEEQKEYGRLCDEWEEVLFGKKSWDVDNRGKA